MLSVEENRELLALGDVLGHQAEDAFVAVDEQVRAPQLRQPGDNADRRPGPRDRPRCGASASGAAGRSVSAWWVSASSVPRNRSSGILYPDGGHEHAASADGDGGRHAGGNDRTARRRHGGALVVARRSARQRRHGRAQHRQPGAQARRRVRGGAVQEGRPRAGRRRRLHPAGRVQDAPHRRGEVEPRAGAGRQDRAAHARRGREHQRAGRSGAVGRRAARVRRLRPEHSRAQHQRLRRREPQGRDRRLRLVDAEVAAGSAAGAFRLGRRALEDVQGRRRDRHDQHRQPEEHGHPVGALDARAAAAGDVARRRRRSTMRRASSCRSR